jgi:hypothetical protein
MKQKTIFDDLILHDSDKYDIKNLKKKEYRSKKEKNLRFLILILLIQYLSHL